MATAPASGTALAWGKRGDGALIWVLPPRRLYVTVCDRVNISGARYHDI